MRFGTLKPRRNQYQQVSRIIQRALDWLNRCRKDAEQTRLLANGPAFKCLLFHAIYNDAAGPCPAGLDTSLVSSLTWVEHCLTGTLQQGFRFIGAEDLPQAVISRERLALLTLDDGYANNRLLLPLLHRLQIPALVFVTTDPMLRQRSYWWDVLAREMANNPGLSKKRRLLKLLTPAQIEVELGIEFGENCFHPQGDHDRPMTSDELREFAREPLISIGNHTHRHALLDQLSEYEVSEELRLSQGHLTELLGTAPTTIAYPNGRWNSSVANLVRKAGIRFAFTTERALSPLPMSSMRQMSIPRHQPMQK